MNVCTQCGTENIEIAGTPGKCPHEYESEIKHLLADIENLAWNLAGCSTFAMGYGIEEPFAEELARPALFDVLKLAKREKRLREALKKIVDLEDSDPYYQDIAEAALAEGRANLNGEALG